MIASFDLRLEVRQKFLWKTTKIKQNLRKILKNHDVSKNFFIILNVNKTAQHFFKECFTLPTAKILNYN